MSFLVGIVLALAALTSRAAEPPIVVGVTVAQSGALATLAAEYQKGLILWQEELNAAGGLLGRQVALRLHDDGSDAGRAGELYAELIRDKADLLIGPYGSAATLTAAAQAERAQRVLINGAGAARAVHKRAARYVFQSTVPNAAFGIGPVELAKAAGHSVLFILARDDPMSREMAEAARETALKLGLKPSELAIYRATTTDFAREITKAIAEGAQAWIAFGELRDTADMVRSFKKLDYAPGLFFARSAADARLLKLVGQDAEFAQGAREYDPGWRTPGNERFVQAFAAKWGTPPGPAAAEGYTAGTVLAEAVWRAGTLDQEKLRATLATLEMPTVLGGYKVDRENGEQTAARPAVVQILKGKAETVWPEPLRTAQPVPYAAWSERRLLGK